MNEVEKMMQNANLINYYCGDDYIFEAMLEVECTNGDKEKCKTCNKAKTNYPPFTAEKQIELIKWLGIIDEFNFYQNKVTKDWVFYDHEKDVTHYNFKLGLASWINYLWQSLTEEERKQIKEILE